MTNLLASILMALLVALGFGGCVADQGREALEPEDPGLPASRVGTMLVTWDAVQVSGLGGNSALGYGEELITTDTERDRLLASAPLGPDSSEVAEVNLEHSVILVAGFDSCEDTGTVWGDGVSIWFDTDVPEESRDILCESDVFTVEIFEVPRSAFRGEVRLVTPPWDD